MERAAHRARIAWWAAAAIALVMAASPLAGRALGAPGYEAVTVDDLDEPLDAYDERYGDELAYEEELTYEDALAYEEGLAYEDELAHEEEQTYDELASEDERTDPEDLERADEDRRESEDELTEEELRALIREYQRAYEEEPAEGDPASEPELAYEDELALAGEDVRASEDEVDEAEPAYDDEATLADEELRTDEHELAESDPAPDDDRAYDEPRARDELASESAMADDGAPPSERDPDEEIAALRALIAQHARDQRDREDPLAWEKDAMPKGYPVILEDELMDEALGDADVDAPTEVTLAWENTAIAAARVALMVALIALLLLLASFTRDLRLALSGAFFCALTTAAAATLVWPDDPRPWLLAYVVQPLAPVAVGLVVLTARRRRGLLLGLALASYAGLSVLHEQLARSGAFFELLGLGLTLLWAVEWLVLVAVCVDHAWGRSVVRPRDDGGPYRHAPATLARADGAALPRGAIVIGVAWAGVVGGLRVAEWLGLAGVETIEINLRSADLALAVAATYAAFRAPTGAHQSFAVVAGIVWAMPLLFVAYELMTGASAWEAFGYVSRPPGPMLLLLTSAAFAGAAACLVGGLRAIASRRARDLGDALREDGPDDDEDDAPGAPPEISSVELVAVMLGAALVPWALRYHSEWVRAHTLDPLFVAGAIGGLFVLRRYLSRLDRWLEATTPPPVPAAPPAVSA